MGDADSSSPQPEPVPLYGETEVRLLRLALPAVLAELAAADSLRDAALREEQHRDTIEVKAVRPWSVGEGIAPWIKGRLRGIEVTGRGDVHREEISLRYFGLTPPLRTRELHWNRRQEFWTLSVEDSIGEVLTLTLPRRARARSGYLSYGTLYEGNEGTAVDHLVLMAAQPALRNPLPDTVDPHEAAAALRAVRDRMARYIAKLRSQ